MASEKPLSSKEDSLWFKAIGVGEFNDNMDFDSHVYAEKDVASAVEKVLERIRLSENRDDKVHATLKILDGGGIGKQEVYKIIKEEIGSFE